MKPFIFLFIALLTLVALVANPVTPQKIEKPEPVVKPVDSVCYERDPKVDSLFERLDSSARTLEKSIIQKKKLQRRLDRWNRNKDL